MKKILIIILVLFLNSCAIVPKSTQKAKNKISKYKDRIEMMAAYHKLDSVWIENKEVTITTPEIVEITKIETIVVKETEIDSILVEYCNQKDSISILLRNQLKEELYKNCIPDPVFFEDEFLELNFYFKADGVVVSYKIKEQEIKEQVPCEQTIINANIPWHEEKKFWLFVVVLALLTLVSIKIKKWKL